MPLISICVAVYNLESYIKECLDSVLMQDFDDYELIVVDNGSTDNSIEICKEYEKKYSNRMKFFSLPRPTVAVRAHIFAVEQAQGEYIHLIDGDDCVAQGYLKNIAQIIKDKSPELIMGSFECIVEKGAANYLDVQIDSTKINGRKSIDAINYIYSLPYFNRYVWRFVVSRRLFDLVKFDKDVAHLIIADNIKANVWLMNTKSIYYYNGPFYYYRRRVGSTVCSKNNAMTLDFIKGIIAITKVVFELPNEETISRFLKLLASQIEWYLRLFISDYENLSYNELFSLSKYIDKYLDVVYKMKMYDIKEINEFVDLISTYGSFEGIVIYGVLFKSRLYRQVENISERPIYIFPAGNYAESTCRLLQDWNFKIQGFIDNDIKKQGCSFLGLQCMLPNSLLIMEGIDKKDIVVLISTIYKKLSKEFKAQLLELGLSENQIFIRE